MHHRTESVAPVLGQCKTMPPLCGTYPQIRISKIIWLCILELFQFYHKADFVELNVYNSELRLKSVVSFDTVHNFMFIKWITKADSN
jgi:hypothetical protein